VKEEDAGELEDRHWDGDNLKEEEFDTLTSRIVYHY